CIYYTGHIDKIDLEGVEKVKYVYQDKNDKKHNLTDVYEIIKVDELKNGESINSVPQGYVKEDTTSNERKKYTYVDKIVIEGTKDSEKNKIKKYVKTGSKTPLIKIVSKDYTKQNTPIQFELMSGSTRPYINPNAFACV